MKRRRVFFFKSCLPIILLIGLASVQKIARAQGESSRESARPNIALNAPAIFETPPNYPLTTDEDDAKQLTDGQGAGTRQATAEGFRSLWMQKGTVGWQNVNPAIVTIDLGKIQPISGVSLSSGAGRAGVAWPSAIYVGVSDDKQSWRAVGDLIVLSLAGGQTPPQPDVDAVFRYQTPALKTKGRYVAFAIYQEPYAFTDEIEVFRGDDHWLNEVTDEPIFPGLSEMVEASHVRAGVVKRLTQDLHDVREAVHLSSLTATREMRLQGKLTLAEAEISKLPYPKVETFSTTIPQNNTHAKILAVYGEVLGMNRPQLVAWKTHRYAWLPLLAKPVTGQGRAPSLSIEMMGNEHRADSFLLTNASGKAMTVRLSLSSLPGGPKPSWLDLASVPWTDTAQHIPVAAALPEAPFVNGAFNVSIPAGLTRKIWLSVDSSKLQVGTHKGSIKIIRSENSGKPLTVPLSVRVSPVKMHRPRLSLGVWDYSEGKGAYGITPRNRQAAIRLMKSHFVDSPWAQSNVLPRPVATDFDSQQQLKAIPKFDVLDAWIKEWPEARNYMVFASVNETFAGAKVGSAEFDGRVGSWAKALSQHMSELRLKPQQLAILLLDEPKTDAQDAIIAGWARAINMAAPELTLFQDPTWERPDQTKIQDAIIQVDIVAPNIRIFHAAGEPVGQYYRQRRAAGQTLWFYQCDGPARLFSPSRYHRLQAWYAWKHGATGLGFWSFGDIGGARSSWNDYVPTYIASDFTFSPVFIGPDNVTDGIHWQAVREGIEDYEYLAMLRGAAAKTTDAGLKERALALLAEGENAVTANWSLNYFWSKDNDVQTPDTYRLRVLSLLEKM